jgi:MtrB/PioB family decaheme-associated outer membrane protein
MKIHNRKMRVSVLTLAVEGALLAMFAMPAVADDTEATTLMTPTNFVEFGALYDSQDSNKFGEYTGLTDKGGYVIGNFSVRGGDSYGSGNGTTRWLIEGHDLGLTSRSLDASMSNQGQWSLGIGYDELQHNLTDGYQTPYVGKMGGNSFVLPPNFGSVSTNPTPNNTNFLTPPQIDAFHTVDVHTNRKNTSFNAGYTFNPQWDIKFDFNHLDQSGAKLMAFGLNGAGGVSGEKITILPNPTNYQTDTVNLALNWKGDKGFVSGAYFGSFFHDDYESVSVQSFSTGANNNVMTTAPSNDFHQLNLIGGYTFSPTTRLSGGLSYGRNTQNKSFIASPLMNTPAPASSLDGVVITTHADLKLTDQTTKDLTLAAGIKYDERDNQTSSNIYDFNGIGWNGTPGTKSNQAIYPNTPLSLRKTQLELAGDYRLDTNQHIRLAYNHDDVRRWCDQYAASTGVAPGALGYYPAGTNCVVATDNKEDKLGATYKVKASDDVDVNAGYSYSDRRTDSDQKAIAAMIGENGNPNPSLPAATLINGINAGDYVGFYPVFDAARREQLLKADVNWQANDRLALTLGGRYTDDNYYDSTYGVQNGNSWSLNLDATYVLNENGSVSAYLTQQNRQRDMTNLQRSPYLAASAPSATAIGIPPGATWTNTLKEDDFTLGIGAKQGALMDGKLELAGDLTYSLGKTSYETLLNYATATTGGVTCSNPAIYSCGSLPDIKNELIQFTLTGTYQVDKSAHVALGYLYQHLNSKDYYYNAYQYGSTPTGVLPTNQETGSYSVNVVAVSYVYTFK